MRCTACGSASPPGMRFCGMCGRPLGAPAEERERRRVSVVFVDLTGFSSLTHGLDPEETRDLADEVLTEVASVVEDYDGYVDAFRGDGLMAVFGAPRSHPDDPYRAVVAAEASLRAIERVGAAKGVDLQGRAGVTTGVVIAGAIGSGRVREYTVMGSVVNLASRLEHAAGAGEVWTAEETYQATRHRLTYEKVSEVRLPAFPNVTEAYRLHASEHRDPDPYARVRFVGRARELDALAAWHRGVRRTKRTRVAWLVGEAGSGKTRLLQEFAAGLDPATTVVWLHARNGDASLWTELAAQVFGLREADDVRARAATVQQALAQLLPGEARWHRLVLESLDLVPEVPWKRLERRAVDRTLLAWRDVLVAIAHRRVGVASLALFVESDRFDADLEAFVECLTGVQAPMLVVRTSRGRDLPPGADALTIAPLSITESLELLDQVADPVFRVAMRSLVHQVGGVPASVFELGRALSITQDTHFSGSLTSLLQTRLDMLEPAARRLLALAALTGERTWEGLLAAFAGDVRHGLRTLRGSDLLVRQSTSRLSGQTEYGFRSELLRHAVLQMTPFSERPMLHLHIATWLEQHAPLALSELTAEHFEKGGAADAAYAYYLTAAAEADADEDEARADRLYQRLLALDVAPLLRAEGLLAYAQATLLRGDRRLALAQLDRADQTLARCEREACSQLLETTRRLRAEALALIEPLPASDRLAGGEDASADAEAARA
ncbi:MAG: adenylate/guanylate cyclase domain-containing protein [Trueperaceae bacterium]|nr:adenylate/guanylate cyclase domain-containing protein [Trueperaceae bacterium]